MPILLRRSSMSCLLLMVKRSSPSTRIRPAVASVSFDMQRSKVDFPEPDSPMMTSSSPARTSKDALLTPTMQLAALAAFRIDCAVGAVQQALRILSEDLKDGFALDDGLFFSGDCSLRRHDTPRSSDLSDRCWPPTLTLILANAVRGSTIDFFRSCALAGAKRGSPQKGGNQTFRNTRPTDRADEMKVLVSLAQNGHGPGLPDFFVVLRAISRPRRHGSSCRHRPRPPSNRSEAW